MEKRKKRIILSVAYVSSILCLCVLYICYFSTGKSNETAIRTWQGDLKQISYRGCEYYIDVTGSETTKIYRAAVCEGLNGSDPKVFIEHFPADRTPWVKFGEYERVNILGVKIRVVRLVEIHLPDQVPREKDNLNWHW